MPSTDPSQFQHMLRFQSLSNPGCTMQFPCDEAGHVAMDILNRRALQDYLFARRMVGREFLFPLVLPGVAT